MQLKIQGVVQGVGFRPFVYNLAQKCNLHGWVKNETDGVMIEVEGSSENLENFYHQIKNSRPKLSKIDNIDKKYVSLRNYKNFTINPSQFNNKRTAIVPPDAAVCPHCIEEIIFPDDRHYLYPFTNCTFCGPRFTIIRDIPYDRDKTTMGSFIPCKACEEEYNLASDRRFHAQPVACPQCGPNVEIIDRQGDKVEESNNWLEFFWINIEAGNIFAIKGIGGYHLACKMDQDVIGNLRKRKKRPFKPFALMCRDLEAVKKYCQISKHEADLLSLTAAPVVLLTVKDQSVIPVAVNPYLNTLGVILPYSPLHYLLLQGPFDVMVMTSANPTDLPILKDNLEALECLKNIADYFIVHNRDIYQRCDDSVVRSACNRVQYHRRSRGFVPDPVRLGFSAEKAVIGMGGEMKNTFCIIKDSMAYLSQHLGEMETVESYNFFMDSLAHFIKLHDLQPRVVGYDLHPDYHISEIAQKIPAEKKYTVQHHHAHFASCLADNGCQDRALGAILDGTGYGLDEAIWGFEIISGDFLSFEREYYQTYTSLPGGEFGIKNPWAMALSYLYQSCGNAGLQVGRDILGPLYDKEITILIKELIKQTSSVPTSSCGRLFDSVAALLGICYENTYEGQAAIELSEMLIKEDLFAVPEPYPYHIYDNQINFYPVFPAIVKDLKSNCSKIKIARKFHDTVIMAVVESIKRSSLKTGLKTVALSGGAWHNDYLLSRTEHLLQKEQLKVLLPQNVPPGDGGLSLGQAAVAYHKWKSEANF